MCAAGGGPKRAAQNKITKTKSVFFVSFRVVSWIVSAFLNVQDICQQPPGS
jgi:hypothetical protein